MASKKIYAVRKGRETGIFGTWDECKKQIDGFSGAEYKSFTTSAVEEANAYLDSRELEPKQDTQVNPYDISTYNNDTVMAYIDGSFNESANKYGSGVVLMYAFEGVRKEAASMRNVAGEIEAAMSAIQVAYESGARKIIVNYDYEGVEKWANGSWKTNNEHTEGYKKYIERMSNKIKIEFNHIRAHTGIEGNELADKLAKTAVGIEV